MSTYVSICDQCNCISTNNINDVHWFEKDFCGFKCLEEYYQKSTLQCHDCETPLLSQKLHFTKSSSKENGRGYFDYMIFCSLNCEKFYDNTHSLCGFCSAELNTNQSIESGPMSAFCSVKCEELMKIHRDVDSGEPANCSNCHQLKPIKMGMFWNDVKYAVCSEDCFNEFKRSLGIEIEFCRQCWQCVEEMPTDGMYYVILEKGRQSTFCSSTCMVFFMSHHEKAVRCSTCDTIENFYEMIRGADDGNQAWCSLDCLRKHLLGTNQNQAVGEVEEIPNDELVLMKSFMDCCDENNNHVDGAVSSSPCEIDHGTEVTLQEPDANDVLHCHSCDSKISLIEPFFQWHAKYFCSSLCVDFAVQTNDKTQCWACEGAIAVSDTFVYTEYIENELRHFCSDDCLLGCLAVTRMCIQCQMKLSDENDRNATVICSGKCEGDFRRIFSKASWEKEHCIDCKELKPVEFKMIINGDHQPFCSISCLIAVYGTPEDLCTICKNYFIRNKDENFDVFCGVKLNMLCSKICQSHFIRKHQMLVSCSFCDVSNFNSYMLQSIREGGVKIHHFCTMSCYELHVESTADCSVTHASEQIWDKLKKKQKSIETKPKVKEVATQTDDIDTVCTCKCGKDEPRRILVAKKRLNKDNSADQSKNQLVKMPRLQ